MRAGVKQKSFLENLCMKAGMQAEESLESVGKMELRINSGDVWPAQGIPKASPREGWGTWTLKQDREQ